MIKPALLRHIAIHGVSLPTFAVSPAVAKATVYMPSQVAARMLGGRPSMAGGRTIDVLPAGRIAASADTSHAA